jgi:hypothetical protein
MTGNDVLTVLTPLYLLTNCFIQFSEIMTTYFGPRRPSRDLSHDWLGVVLATQRPPGLHSSSRPRSSFFQVDHLMPPSLSKPVAEATARAKPLGSTI